MFVVTFCLSNQSTIKEFSKLTQTNWDLLSKDPEILREFPVKQGGIIVDIKDLSFVFEAIDLYANRYF